jgi:hypothetical protein
VKFPGSKPLHQWELSTETLFSVDGLLRSCEHVNLTGFAEVTFPQAVAMIFFYAGSPVNALYRHGPAALVRLRTQIGAEEGSVAVYELPLDMAHLLRGVTNRAKLDPIASPEVLIALLERLAREEHTGTLEVQTASGAAMILLVSGRVSNIYWETHDGVTFERMHARHRLDAALAEGETQVFLSSFSRDAWRARPESQEIGTLFEPKPDGEATPDNGAEAQLREHLLLELQTQLPSALHGFIFDLMTGMVVARQARGTAAMRAALFTEKVAPLTLYVREVMAVEEHDDIEVIEVTTHHVATLVVVVPEVLEAIAILADKSQPSAVLAAVLTRAGRGYGERLRAMRKAADPGARPI